MKKILLLLLISISGYSQTLLKLKAIEYAPAANYCIITNSLGVQTYTPCSSLSSTVIPTLQQVLTAGNTSTTTGITLTDAPLLLNGLGAPYETYFDAGYGNFKDFNGNQLLEIDGVGNYNASDLWVRIYGNKIVTVNSTDTLTNKTITAPTLSTSVALDYATANRLTYTDGSKLLKSVTLGSGLSLTSGTLSASGSGSTTVLTASTNITINGSAPNYTISTPTQTTGLAPLSQTISASTSTASPSEQAIYNYITSLSSTITGISADIATTSSVSSTTGLTFTVEPNTKYILRGCIKNNCSGTGGDKFALIFPSVTSVAVGLTARTSSSSAITWLAFPSDGTLTAAINTVAGGFNISLINGTFTTSSTGGSVYVYFASTTNGQTSTVFSAGTYLELIKTN